MTADAAPPSWDLVRALERALVHQEELIGNLRSRIEELEAAPRRRLTPGLTYRLAEELSAELPLSVGVGVEVASIRLFQVDGPTSAWTAKFAVATLNGATGQALNDRYARPEDALLEAAERLMAELFR